MLSLLETRPEFGSSSAESATEVPTDSDFLTGVSSEMADTRGIGTVLR